MNGPHDIARDLAQKTAVVIGGASGIGRATAVAFAARGARISLSDIDDERGRAVADELARSGAEVVFTAADIQEPSELEELARVTIGAFGGVDAVFVSAGRIEADLRRMLALYLEGPANCAMAMAPHLESAANPSITFTGSMSGLRAHRGASWYSAAKTGLVGLTRSLALDLAPQGIRVNSVCPSGVDTTMLRDSMQASGVDADARIAEEAARKPLGRWVQAADVAEAAIFLASDRARMITGVSLPVDGGESL